MSTTLPITENDRQTPVYSATAGQTAFAVDFPFQEDGDLEVLLVNLTSGSETPFALTTQYTVTGKGNPSGGTVTLLTGRAEGDRIVIRGKTGTARTTGVTQNGKFRSQAYDYAFDRLTMLAQELRRDITRALVIAASPAGSGAGDMLRSTYDTTENGIVDAAEKLAEADFGLFSVDGAGQATLNAGTINGSNLISGSVEEAKLSSGLQGLFNAWRYGVGVGQGQFQYDSATQCRLMPYNGRLVSFPNGDLLTIPSAGLVFSNSGLASNSLLYAYVYNDGGTLAPEWSATGHVADDASGLRVKDSDDTRVLVGMARTNSSSQFNDSAAKRHVASWNNRRTRTLYNQFSTGRTTNSGAYAEINSEIRCEFVCWGDAMQANYAGSVSSSSSQAWFSGVSLDGSGSGATLAAVQGVTGTSLSNASVVAVFAPSEGYHYVTVMGATAGGATGTWSTGSENGKLFGLVVI